MTDDELQAHIKAAVDRAPELTPEQKERLVQLLRVQDDARFIEHALDVTAHLSPDAKQKLAEWMSHPRGDES